jgi:hypothetical protein
MEDYMKNKSLIGLGSLALSALFLLAACPFESTNVPYSATGGFWTFETISGKTVADETGVNDGVMLNMSANNLARGKGGGQALKFDNWDGTEAHASQAVRILNSKTLSPSSITVELNVRFEQPDTAKPLEHRLVFKCLAYDIHTEYDSGASKGKVYFLLTPAGSAWDSTQCKIIIDKDLYDGYWHHLAMTYDKETGAFKVYIDGNKEDEKTLPTTGVVYNTEDLYIGGAFWDGRLRRSSLATIDNVRISDRALEPEEFYPGPGATIAWWKFDEASGTIAHDDENGFDGVLLDMDDTVWVSGNSGNALKFPNTGGTESMNNTRSKAVQISTNPLLSPGSFSIEFQVKFDDATKNNHRFIFKLLEYGIHAEGTDLYFILETNTDQKWGVSGVGADKENRVMIDTTRSGAVTDGLKDGAWHRIAMTYDQSTGRATMYYDDVVETVDLVDNGGIYDSGADLFIGTGYWWSDPNHNWLQPTNGIMDNVRISSVVLEPANFIPLN